MDTLDSLSQSETKELSMRMTRKKDQIRNWYNNAKGKNKVPINVIIDLAKEKVFQTMFYNELVKPLVDMEKNQLWVMGADITRNVSLAIAQKHMKAVWNAVSVDVREAVNAKMAKLKLEKEQQKVKVEPGLKTETSAEDDVAEDPSATLKQAVMKAQYLQGKDRVEFLQSALHILKQIGKLFMSQVPSTWLFLGMVPSLQRPGKLTSMAVHIGLDANSCLFNEAYPAFDNNIIGPFLEFAKESVGMWLST
ncbi:hypothetical protein GYMLUDRAFT_252915 [Collybiopsis luxurians FD-317 M1]|uniref:Uncharacterized protein n=1 Tax=Collybiopsis luxurians FD-317 M1 TaxID=944289 RepID=A0A0D0BM97_9AGAR|nr:hypothetical protein GYMLUDRAFT_252915 [Collybiopsis luxurians FD-317 M1]